MTDDTIEIDGKRYRRMQVGEVCDETCIYSYLDGGHVLYGTIHGSPAGKVRPETPYAYYAPADRPPLIVETEHWRTLRDDEEVRPGDQVMTAHGAVSLEGHDSRTSGAVSRALAGRVRRRCTEYGEDL